MVTKLDMVSEGDAETKGQKAQRTVELGAEGRLGGVMGAHDELSFDLQLEAPAGHPGRDTPAGISTEPRTEGQDRRERGSSARVPFKTH